MKDVFLSNMFDDQSDVLPVADVLSMCGLRTIAALALEGAIAHPLAGERDTLVIQADLRSEEEEFSLVRLALASGSDAVCVLGPPDADGTDKLLVVQAGEDSAWIGYCSAFADSAAAQGALVPLDPAQDLHLVMGVDGRLQRRDGRPATHPAFGQRIAAARIRRAAEAILAEGRALAA
ncbi:hypothetical protein [Sphingomonas corticis]|uniref:Uncharacterized protein n=1 Tax=Sphingomonas corticis TaxID=2722791 RepID=A0ABX1CNV7_9SPHN|nr:hypothetical protein [Sphingomonas corticis]NJR79164.1 hypothetical protein [Sphingomonas corticis]